jgi:tetratricopeptide (TPR) repeat protein
LGGGAVLLALLVLFRGSAQAWWARRAATSELRAGAVSAAQGWLAWLARFRPEDGRADVIRAACFRSLRQGDRFAAAMRSAKQNKAPPELIEREVKLAQIQSGQLPEDPERQLAAMIEAGASPHDVCTAFVYGFLYRKQSERAKKVLDAWATDFPEHPAAGYMQGVYWRSLGEYALAEDALQAVLQEHPRHELARIALAELLEERGDLERALGHRFHLADSSPSSDTARLNLARLLRKTARIDEAQAVAARLASADEASADALWEWGEIALERGDYQEAQRRFQESHAKRTYEGGSLFATAAALALQGDSDHAETLLARATSSATAVSLGGDAHGADPRFKQLNDLYAWLQRVQHLRAILAVRPNDRSRARELEALSSAPPFASTPENAGGGAEEREEADSAPSGPELYRVHCAACHGADGEGNGRAARHLYPRPTNLRSGNYRLVRTVNAVPTLEGVEATVERGMPGASMPSFEDLSPSHRTLLAREALRWYREGVREQIVTWLSEAAEETDEEEIRRTVEELTTPGEFVQPPEIGPATPPAIARGREWYERLGCFHCHGDDGKGPADVLLTNADGLPTSSRDLTREPFKGGDEPEAVYLRLVLGMPGTPHPACADVAEEELVDLVHFCRSLRREPVRTLTNYERMLRATRGHLPGVSDAP